MKYWHFIPVLFVGLIVALSLTASTRVKAQLTTTNVGPGGFGAAASYTGPGDVVSGAVAWWGLRAYSAAKTGTKIANICNSGDANCADINSLSNGKFDVTTAQGAPLNCGGAGGTCTIKTLYDQSGGTNCTTSCDATQATAANRPTLVFNCLNTSLPCMRTTTSTSMAAPSLSATVSSPYTYSIVWGNTSNGGSGGIVGFSAVQNEIGNNPTDTIGLKGNGGAFFNVTAAAATYHSVQGIANGSSSAFYVDGTSTTGGTIDATNPSGAPLLASTEFASQWFEDIAEAGLWDQDFSASSFTKASAMCHNQFGFWATATSC